MKNLNQQNKIESFLKKLISYKTTSENTRGKMECLECISEEFGKDFQIENLTFKNDFVAIYKNTDGREFDLVIACHLDVVSGGDSIFSAKDAGGKIYGRGSIDMKGPLVAVLCAFREYIHRDGNKKIAIVITTDEEIGGDSTKWLNESGLIKANFALLPDGGTEETDLVIKQKGFWQIKIAVGGKSAHASRPWEGKNPIENGFSFYKHLLEIFPHPRNKDEWKTSVVLTKMKAGKSVNQIPETALFFFDIRFIDEKDREFIRTEANNFFHDKIMEEIGYNGIFEADQGNTHILVLKNAMEKIYGKPVAFSSECGTSDAIFYGENGIPAALLRPKGNGLHQEEEWIDKKSLSLFYEVILEFMLNLP